ncbi:hypothetical protein E4U41_007676 [Claviceps citrina]|nr:hypothetical protein E4U41_007676 [Claviceps citrina]
MDVPRLAPLPMEDFFGSTALFFRLRPGILLKAAVKMGPDREMVTRDSVENNFRVEEQILARLGAHPRTVSYLGRRTEFPTGLLFAEASHGSLESYLHRHGDDLAPGLRQRWFAQAVEAVVFLHSKGVMHSDLRPDNFLVHGAEPSLDLWLCDFGGSSCPDLGLCGGTLPDAGFHDPNAAWEVTYAADIFSLGSVLYAIVTGHWPFRATAGQFPSEEESYEYEADVNRRFAEGIYPDVAGLFGGDIILGCWTGRFSEAAQVMARVSDLTFEC